MRIEYSRVTRHYYVPRAEGGCDTFTRKDEAERAAKKRGAIEIEHKTRSTSRDLQRIGFSRNTAVRVARSHFSGGRR